jgi:hypothetical protein
MVHDLLPLALRGIERCCDRLLAVCMVARNVKELPRGLRCAASESVDEGGAGRAVLQCRDGVVVSCAGKLGATLGEASDVLAQALLGLLLAIAQLPLLAGTGVRALKVPDEDPVQVGPAVDHVAGQVLEPCLHGISEVERQVLDDE